MCEHCPYTKYVTVHQYSCDSLRGLKKTVKQGEKKENDERRR